MQLSAFGTTAGYVKVAPPAGHDTHACILMNSSRSVGLVQAADGNRISKIQSFGTFRTFVFSAIPGMHDCEKCPKAQQERHFVPNFRSSKFRTIPFFVPSVSVCNVRNSGRGTVTTLCVRPSLKQQSSNQKQQDNTKPRF